MSEPSGNENPSPSLLSRIKFRTIGPMDINRCHEIERASYPSEEAASRSSLQYRQHHAEKYFRCAVLKEPPEDEDDDDDDYEARVIGFICATRTNAFDHQSMSTHDSSGRLLAIHSVVVEEPYRRQGVATAMLRDYIRTVETISTKQRNKTDACHIETLVLMAKSQLIGLYCTVGFHCLGISPIVHGSDRWFHLELALQTKQMVSKATSSVLPMEVGLPCWTVDAFTQTAGAGNPAAVVMLPSAPGDESEKAQWFQMVAAEFNLSETAFVWAIKSNSRSDGDGEGSGNEESTGGGDDHGNYAIRYFTRTVEVDLCGHATLASAAVLFQEHPNLQSITFHARKDTLGAARAQAGGDALKIAMNFPQKALTELNEQDKKTLSDMLGSTFTSVSFEGEKSVLYSGIDEDGGDVLVELSKECFDAVEYENNNYQNLFSWEGYSRGILLCCNVATMEGIADFESRCFFPKCGIAEDPVTGSAHCTLAPYFATKLAKSTSLIAHQASKRGGWIECNVINDRVELIGSAVIVMNGTLQI